MRSNVVAFVGLTNAGKSTLINSLVGQKASIATPKVQTTQRMLRCIYTEADTQLVLIDTPGFFEHSKSTARVSHKITRESWRATQEADSVALVVDASRPHDLMREQCIQIKDLGIVCDLVLNKVDKVAQKSDLLLIAEEFSSVLNLSSTFMINAFKKPDVDTLRSHFMSRAIDRPWSFDADQLIDESERFMATESIREKIFFNTHNELPYSVDVRVKSWSETDSLIKITIAITVQTLGQQKIVIGKGGEVLKKIGSQARVELEKTFGKKVFLELLVGVK